MPDTARRTATEAAYAASPIRWCCRRDREGPSEVFNTLLQPSTRGRLTEGRDGRWIATRSSPTSNVGSREAGTTPRAGGATARRRRAAVATRRRRRSTARCSKRVFAPEFLNRIDDIIVFRTLDEGDVRQIVDLELEGAAPTGRPAGVPHAHHRRSPAPSGLDGLRSPLRRTGPQTHAGRPGRGAPIGPDYRRAAPCGRHGRRRIGPCPRQSACAWPDPAAEAENLPQKPVPHLPENRKRLFSFGKSTLAVIRSKN